MTPKKHIVIMVGGGFAPAAATFAQQLAAALDDRFVTHAIAGAEAFHHLVHCDALVLASYHAPQAAGADYRPLTRLEKQDFGSYVSAGQPLIVTPEGAASFPDWPRYAELVGFTARVLPQDPAVVPPAGVYADPTSFCGELAGSVVPGALVREVAPDPRVQTEIHASVVCPRRGTIPLVASAWGGPRPGAGTSLYVGLGPAAAGALAPSLLTTLWRRALLWLTDEAEDSLARVG
jgi:hypothetical protein